MCKTPNAQKNEGRPRFCRSRSRNFFKLAAGNAKSAVSFLLLKTICLFSPVGVKGNLSLLEICFFFPSVSTKWKVSFLLM